MQAGRNTLAKRKVGKHGHLSEQLGGTHARWQRRSSVGVGRV
jgi:hypothetical protein